jgi:hypothetical protein
MNPWGDSWGGSFGGTYPIPADVRLGVNYGPTGAEYTGTLTGGGGGPVGYKPPWPPYTQRSSGPQRRPQALWVARLP